MWFKSQGMALLFKSSSAVTDTLPIFDVVPAFCEDVRVAERVGRGI